MRVVIFDDIVLAISSTNLNPSFCCGELKSSGLISEATCSVPKYDLAKWDRVDPVWSANSCVVMAAEATASVSANHTICRTIQLY